jgi:hypothetical protein
MVAAAARLTSRGGVFLFVLVFGWGRLLVRLRLSLSERTAPAKHLSKADQRVRAIHHQLIKDQRHFIAGLLATADFLRRRIGVVDVGGGVVVDKLLRDFGAFGDVDWLLVKILALPIPVSVLDPDQRHRLAGG